MKRGGPLRKMSSKRKAESAEYYARRRRYMDANPMCEACWKRKATDLHHKKGRGKFYLDESTFMSACRPCHRFLHDHPSWAQERGFLIPFHLH